MISDCITKPIAIEGHSTRGKEVIELLEMIGGNNVHNLSGDDSYAYYVIEGCQNEIRGGKYIFGDEDICCFTLEEFLEKYPFKVGDKVTVQGWRSPGFILRMHIKNFQIVYNIAFIETIGIATNVSVECIKHYHKETQTNKNEMAIFITGNINLKNQDKVEIKLGDDWEIFVSEDGKTYARRKKFYYPKNYQECCEILNVPMQNALTYHNIDCNTNDYLSNLATEINSFVSLKICRDAYLKLGGSKSDNDNNRYCIFIDQNGDIRCSDVYNLSNKCFLEFPNIEMRDVFYNNFKHLIEDCKNLISKYNN